MVLILPSTVREFTNGKSITTTLASISTEMFTHIRSSMSYM